MTCWLGAIEDTITQKQGDSNRIHSRRYISYIALIVDHNKNHLAKTMNLYRECFVCSIKTDEWRSGLSGLVSQHSSTRITVLIRTILGAFQSARNVDDELNCICPDCLSRLEDCDWQRQTTQRCERELYDLLVSTEIQSLAKQKADESEEPQAQATDQSGVIDVDDLHDDPPQAQQSHVGGVRTIRGRRKKVPKHAKVRKIGKAEEVAEARVKSESESSGSNSDDDPNFDCSIEQCSSESELADEDFTSKPRKVATRTRSRRATTKDADPKETKAEPAENALSDSDEQPTRPKRSFKCSQCDEVYHTQQTLKVRQFYILV